MWRFFDIISDMFRNRQQIVKYNNIFSSVINVVSGVFQGGVTSPTLFDIYLSDIINYINCDIYKFADDMVLIRAINTQNDCFILQQNLDKISDYCIKNSLKLNSEKCKAMRITLKNNELFNYKINNSVINHVITQKHVGITYDSKMSFNCHTNEIISKALKKFYTLKFLCKRVDGKTFLRLYKTYILSILEYSNLSVIYTGSQSMCLEKVQKRIMKYICFKLGKYHLTYEQRLEFLKIYSLEKRRKIQILSLLMKVKNKMLGIRDEWFNELEFYESFRNGIFCKIKVNRIELSDKYIFDYSVKLFNNLSKNVRNECNFRKFVNELYKNL